IYRFALALRKLKTWACVIAFNPRVITMAHPLHLIDAFTDRPFAGNPAAVCLLDNWPDDAWMQNVAREMNQSETAFLVRAAEGFHLRWFTPTVEVELCGHATLASAHYLWEAGHTRATEIHFHTKSGLLR